MKKQILFLTFLVLAVMIGISKSYGQTAFGVRTLDCAVTEGPLNPLLGKTYTYSVTIPNSAEFTGTDGLQYLWRVTSEKTFVTAGEITTTLLTEGTEFDIASGAGVYNSTANTSATIDISWNALASETDPFFLLVSTVGDNGVCSTQNLKVYKILPVNQFTLDLANVTDAETTLGWDASDLAVLAQECITDVQSVVWNPATETATYDYGFDTLVYAVVAANWSGSWTPSLTIANSVATGGSLISAVTWGRSTDPGTAIGTFTYNTTDAEWQTTTAVEPANEATNGPNVGATGETVYIHVIVDHTDVATNTFNEGLVDQTFTLAIDGVTENGDSDVHFQNTDGTAGGTADCGEVDGYENDYAAQDLLQRPGINSNTSGGADPLLTPVIAP